MKSLDKYTGRLGNRLFQFAYIFAQAKKGEIPDIYVQDPSVFEQYESELQQLFAEDIHFLTDVGIHVRRGLNPVNPDEPAYTDNPFYVDLCETDYYERAIELFPGKNFRVFSDDIPYVRKRFQGERFQIMEGTELEDFNMLASCESQIIANSSFSWWAAYLNRNWAKKVVAPKAWYSDGIERTKCPDSWIRI